METSPLVVDWNTGQCWAERWDSGNPTMETSPKVLDWDSGRTWADHWDSGNAYWKSYYGSSRIVVDWDSRL